MDRVSECGRMNSVMIVPLFKMSSNLNYNLVQTARLMIIKYKYHTNLSLLGWLIQVGISQLMNCQRLESSQNFLQSEILHRYLFLLQCFANLNHARTQRHEDSGGLGDHDSEGVKAMLKGPRKQTVPKFCAKHLSAMLET